MCIGQLRCNKGFDSQIPALDAIRRFLKPRERGDAREHAARIPKAPRKHLRSIPGTFAAFRGFSTEKTVIFHSPARSAAAHTALISAFDGDFGRRHAAVRRRTVFEGFYELEGAVEY